MAVFLAMAGVVTTAGAATAATPGIVSAEVLLDGQKYNGTQVVAAGQELTLRVQYNKDAAPGSTVEFKFTDSISIPSVPAGNAAVESIVQENNTVKVTFKNPWPSGVDQGVFDLKLKVNEVEKSELNKIAWTLDGEETSIDVIVKKPSDEFANVTNGQNKFIDNNANLGQYVSVTEENGVRTVVVNPNILNAEIQYRLAIDTVAAQPGLVIKDVLPAGFAYVAGSFVTEHTTWDANGLNKVTNPGTFNPQITGNTSSSAFTGQIDLPANSKTKITYKVKVANQAAVTALQTQLQASLDALGAGKYGSFNIPVKNVATFGTVDKDATFSFGGRVDAPPAPPGPEPGKSFSKNASWIDHSFTAGEVDQDGKLITPYPIDYKLTANLTKITGESDFELTQNVVIKDQLPAQAEWLVADPAFITATGNLALDKVTGTLTEAEFAGDDYVGKYWVDGQTLWVNVGKDHATTVVIDVKAQVTTLAGLPAEGNKTQVQGAESFRLRNVAEFTWDEGKADSRGFNSFPTVFPETDEGYNDPSVFSKKGAAVGAIEPGETVTVKYNFVVTAGKGIDVAKSRIVDYVDADIFDVNDADAVKVSGKYNGTALIAADFELGTDADGNLVIELSDSGKTKVTEANKKYEVVLELTSKPFDGKETKTIANKATLFGEDEEPLFWSETESEVTSYGDEAEVRKRVYDRSESAWVQTLDAIVDEDGNLLQEQYVYRVEFIPHGSYNQVTIANVDDVLPDAANFLGFVTEANAATGANPTPGPVDIGGNLEAVYNDGTVTLKQKDGTKLQAGNPIAAYFAVEITDASAPIVNKIGSTTAEIVPVAYPSIDIEKWTLEASGEKPQYNAAGVLQNDGFDGDFDTDSKLVASGIEQEIHFTVSNDGGEALKNVAVSDELVAGEGAISGLVCTFPDGTTGVTWDGPFAPGGQFECVGTLPGLTLGDTHQDRASVTAQGLKSDIEVADQDDWNAKVKSYAVGDYVWIDTNRDGIQDAAEAVLPGVTVILLDGAGVEVDRTVTDDNGRYLFDELEAGEYQIKFELTNDQAALYNFTEQNAGAVGTDSDADVTTGETVKFTLGDDNVNLTNQYTDQDVKATVGIDPTWDAGVVLKTYAVGDYVWIDTNRDGIQDAAEAVLPGVTVILLDGAGVEVERTVTDDNGRYLFDELEAGEYQIKFVLTDAQAQEYKFTAQNAEAAENGNDSDADVVSGLSAKFNLDGTNKSLTDDYSDQDFTASEGVDPTWDAGVVLKSVSVGDFVWFDKDRDGAQGEGEPGIPGVVLVLTGPDGKPVVDIYGEPVGPVTTDEDGKYSFDNLPVLKDGEKYIVNIDREDESTVEALKPYVPTYEEGAERDKDSSTWESESRTLTEDGDRDDTLDFGFILKSYGVGDVVWVDANNNGVQDYDSEEPLAGVTVTLFRVLEDGTLEEVTTDIDGDVVEPQVTDEDGWYMFDYLPAGNYQVQFELTEEQATKYIFTSYVSGDDDSIDSNANPTTGFTDVIALNDDNENLDLEYLEGDFGASEGIDPTWDAGVVVKTYAIGDIVWVDTNRDGIQGETEVLEGVTVTLLNDKGDVITSTKTDKNGRYIFDVLPAGDYQVKFELTKEQAAKYKFTSVNSGKDAKADSDADLGTGLTKVFKLDDNSAGLTTDYEDQAFEANQGIDPTWDAGVVLKSVSVGDFVWEDKDGNGRQDKGEPGIPGVVLEVTGPNGKPVTDVYGNPVKPATTDKDGKYTFENLPVLEPGQCYTVTINQKKSAKALEKYLPTKSGAGDRGGDSSTWTVCSEGLTEDGERDDTLDFGFVLNPEFLAVTGTNLLVPVSVATLALGAGAYLVLRNRKTGSRRA
ncbi:SdrD B-like domain-containing protein [Jonesiaceae bacterium BS-20]|uniref:SdrD B-like domain-containing protein n=1 Tax=Jonesiaceae bacterium BS-20 TaxID=3120821 RepID=A0AAU7DYC2_9MICO